MVVLISAWEAFEQGENEKKKKRERRGEMKKCRENELEVKVHPCIKEEMEFYDIKVWSMGTLSLI